MSNTNYSDVRPLRYHAVPERTDKLRLGTALKRWLSIDVKDATAETLTMSGSVTLAGATALSGAVAFSGAQTGTRRAAEITTAATDTLTEAESGKVFICTATSGTQVFTLPSAATAGLEYTFVCGHADGEINISPITGQGIIGKTHGAENGAGIAVTNGADIKNTAASNVVGDFCTLVSDGGTNWYMVAVAGVWAAA